MNDEPTLLPTAPNALSPALLRQQCDPQQFATTDDLTNLTETIGQKRAIEAVQFGIGMRRDGYNLFTLGPAGMGKHTIIRRFLEQKAAIRALLEKENRRVQLIA